MNATDIRGNSGISVTLVWLALGGLVCPGLLRGASAPAYDRSGVLSENDIGRADDMTTPGRWGQPEQQDGRTFRTYPGPRTLSYVALKRWWSDGESPPEDVVLAVTFKDVTSQAVTVMTWNGSGPTYGYTPVGFVGGSNDGQWKEALLLVARDLVRRRGGEFADNAALLFNGGGTIALDRLAVLKATPERKARAIAQARAARTECIERLKKQFKHVPRGARSAPLEQSLAETFRDTGFVPFAPNYIQDVYADTVPEAEQAGPRPLRTYATPGEHEPLQVAAHALGDATISAEVTDLTGPGTLKAGQHVKVYWIESVPQRVGSSWGTDWRDMPVWMRPAGPVAVKAGQSQAWYVTIAVPTDAQAGTYRGSLRLSARPGGSATFPVEFTVLPFALDRADHVARGPYVPGIVSDEFIRDLTEHGMNSSSMFNPAGFGPKMTDGRCVLEVSQEMDRYLRKLKQGGFVRTVYFGGGDPAYNDPARVASACGARPGSEKFAQAYGEFWQDIRRKEKDNGWPEIICCPFDEAVKSPEKINNYLVCYDIVKKVAPDTQVFCVFMNRKDAVGRLGTKSDIWSCNGAFAENSAEKQRLAGQGIGKLLYTYTGAMGSTRPGSARYNAGVIPWHFQADGTYFWAYLWSNGDPFNDLDAEARDWSPVARDVDGIVYSSIGWEGYREGVDDQRYIQTAVRLAREKGRKDVLEQIEKLRASITPGAESDESRRTAGLDDFFIKMDNASALDGYRAKVVSLILDMLGQKPR